MSTLRPYNGPAGAFGPKSDRWEALVKAGRARRVFVDDDDGSTAHAYEITKDEAGEAVSIVVAHSGPIVIPPGSAAETAANAAAAAAAAAVTKRNNNAARIETLAKSAARFAKDPVANASSKLTDRQVHELLARMALADKADDQ